jgi:hypothetical protein
MLERRFSLWLPWTERGRHDGISCPGVYAIALPERSLAGAPFAWNEHIVYIGMTNSVNGLASRLKQFQNTLSGKRGHGGADRVRFKFRNASQFTQQAFVAVAPFNCDPRSLSPRALRVMGDVARFEFLCLAEYVERFGRLPQFNDKQASPKFSLANGARGRRRSAT